MPNSLSPAGTVGPSGGPGWGVSVSSSSPVAASPFFPPPALAAGPSVTVNQSMFQLDPTSASQIHFTVKFDQPVTGFASDDVVLDATAGSPLTAFVSAVVDGYDVVVSGMSTAGWVRASVRAGAATGLFGGASSQASTSLDNLVIWSPPPGGFVPITPTRVGSAALDPAPALTPRCGQALLPWS